MSILVVGATGATGRLLVTELLSRGEKVRVIVRSAEKLSALARQHETLTVIEANLLDLSDEELVGHVAGCNAVASCLGHNLTFRGMFGSPRRLVTDATRRLCHAIQNSEPDRTTKFVLMNTSGNINRDLNEKVSVAEHCVLILLRLLVPPHPDNEQAAEFLRTRIGQKNSLVEWAAVRPDSLIDKEEVSEYSIHPSPTRSALFNAGKTSRINVAHFMAELITNEEVWEKWKGQMPVIYNVGNGG